MLFIGAWMALVEKMGIVLAAYGSLDSQARGTYEKIKSTYEQAFPGTSVVLAFTSDTIRRRLSEEQDILFQNPSTALAELQDLRCRNVVVQSLQIVPGSEFHKAALLVNRMMNDREKSGFRNIVIGMPLLACLEDCMKVSKTLRSVFQTTKFEGQDREISENLEDVAFVFMGHGTNHPADSVYSLMAGILEKDHRNVFLGTLEGFPGVNDVLRQAKRSGVEKVILMPFLIVAGGHALEDLAGDSANSWKNVFEREGFGTEVDFKGLGENDDVVKILIEHTRKAAELFEGK
jgi:sirohydrochlorin cobaltochelatase